MTSGIEFNKSYNSSYIILPLPKMKDENGKTLVVCSADKELDAKINTSWYRRWRCFVFGRIEKL